MGEKLAIFGVGILAALLFVNTAPTQAQSGGGSSAVAATQGGAWVVVGGVVTFCEYDRQIRRVYCNR